MIVIANVENGDSVDRINKEELDLNGISIPEDEDIQVLHLNSMIEHFASPWEIKEMLKTLVIIKLF